MDPALIVAIVTPVIGLGGVILGLWLGQRRWAREQERKDREVFSAKLESTYLELWDVVEDIHLRMRNLSEPLTATQFAGYIADVNNFMIRKGLFITRGDRYLVLEYLFWTYEFLRRTLANPKARALVMISLVHEELETDVAELDEIRKRADDLRQQLRLRIREEVKAPSSNGWNPDEKPSADLTNQLSLLAQRVASRPDPEVTFSPELMEGWTFPDLDPGDDELRSQF